MTIADNLHHIQGRIAAAARRVDRNATAIRLVAVSKTKPAAAVREALQAGQPLFGENYVQELLAKAVEVDGEVEWHFIGSLQSNKVKHLVGKVTMIHSVDRLTLAQEIDRQWGKQQQSCDILMEVNLAGETSKGGASEAEAMELVRQIAMLPNLRVRGLMTMPPFFDDPEAARPYFRRLRELSQKIAAKEIPGVEMNELSMGMSGDFEVAIEEGATLVRVGSAIFGGR
ncbi:MAG TPA: YggS family pyridoxal phosphate-dependent enzyme [Geobacterales bacterium]|nr:YggS family pyridoxal phosphate-dependent enzyme [Geobacterales bacterium]